jgi:hypothetical protein
MKPPMTTAVVPITIGTATTLTISFAAQRATCTRSA